MGLILGKIKVETPKYELVTATNDYEIRKYQPSVVAEVTYDPVRFNSDKDGGFKILANYIGVFGKPQNIKTDKIEMTVPIITKTVSSSEQIAMTVPVVTKSGGGGEVVTMGFILPSKYMKAEDAPRPVDETVVIREEGERKCGVVKFSGVAREGVVAEKVDKLRACLERDGYKVTGDFVLARYNPPWITLPPLRTNEVMIPVE
ncbi:hypothetical protein CASFOL_015674 [Castilleja foliolosa]|uniref:SOUL heme-binding protein n=1 Tax=Castilleja foliolosa TaxID=1961234 RepID=A0ABD3DIF5_9LAMI